MNKDTAWKRLIPRTNRSMALSLKTISIGCSGGQFRSTNHIIDNKMIWACKEIWLSFISWWGKVAQVKAYFKWGNGINEEQCWFSMRIISWWNCWRLTLSLDLNIANCTHWLNLVVTPQEVRFSLTSTLYQYTKLS